MYFFTHLFISKALYRHYSKTKALNPLAFSYGNIKPDLPPMCLKKGHTLDNYLFILHNEAGKLMKNEYDSSLFSVKLGEICHFASDFFCYYHKDKKTYNKKFKHFLYELILHSYLITGSIKKEITTFIITEEPRRNILGIILELQREYHLDQKNMKTDIKYAMAATVWICDSIYFFMQDSASSQVPDVYIPAYQSVQGGK